MADVLDTEQRDPSKSPEYSAKTGEQGPRIEPKDGVDLQPEEWEQILEAYTTEYCGSGECGASEKNTAKRDNHGQFAQRSGDGIHTVFRTNSGRHSRAAGVPLGFFGLGQQGGYAGVVAQVKATLRCGRNRCSGLSRDS